jgi:hypothetical protein
MKDIRVCVCLGDDGDDSDLVEQNIDKMVREQNNDTSLSPAPGLKMPHNFCRGAPETGWARTDLFAAFVD